GAEHEEHQPRYAALPHLNHAGARIRFVRGGDTGHEVEVLRGLFLQDVYDVVNGDDTDQTVFLVHHRDGEQVVVRDALGGLAAVIGRAHKDDVGVHDVLDDGLVVAEQQVLDGD